MSKQKGRVIRLSIEDEVKESYLNYAMSVIVARALPDVRDGLKPVHRRILYVMNELGLRPDRRFVKTGRIIGDALGKYHPHGDQSIYDALVRLAQDFSLRYPLVNGQGNFGSMDGDPPAAMRYTEAKFNPVAEEMLRDIGKETVDFGPNYDDSMTEPLVLPAAFPHLLVNGGSGIAVGMATNIPPHNLGEIANAIVAMIEEPGANVHRLMEHVRAPDFPTGGIIFGTKGVRSAYETGRGKIVVRARITLEANKNGRDIIIVNELPYQVNKANLVIRIADLVREKKVEGIADLRDESGRDEPVRIVIELRRGMIPKVVLNQLFQHTALQSNFNVNNLALVNGRPRLLGLKEMVQYFIDHRKEVITRRTRYDLQRAEERAHILEGLKKALDNIDAVVEVIKKSSNVETARNNLMGRFELSEKQAQAVLDMRLQRLTSLEIKKVMGELEEVLKKIAYFKEILADEGKILRIVKQETQEIARKYGDERRTEIIDEEIEEFDIEDLIVKEDMVILISHRGYIKRIPVSAYRRQNRGGMGSTTITMRDDDFAEQVFIASTHDYLLFITSEGKAYWLKVHQLPVSSRVARGQNIKALLSISNDEEITTVLPFKEFSDSSYIFMATSRGVVKKVKTLDFINARANGIIAISLSAGDKLVNAGMTHGGGEVVLVTRRGYALRFNEDTVRPTGRKSQGVAGIRLADEDELAGSVAVLEGETMLLVTELGYGKRIKFDNFAPHGRATRGQFCYKTSRITGEIVGVKAVATLDDLVCITSQGNLLKIKTKDVSVQGKSAQGVHIVNINAPDVVVGIARVARES